MAGERIDGNTVQKLASYYDARMIIDLCQWTSKGQMEGKAESATVAQKKLSRDLLTAAGLPNEKQKGVVVAEEKHKEAARQILEQCGILEKRDGKWRIADGMDNKFRDVVYLARFREREAEVASETFKAAFALAKRGAVVGLATTSVGNIVAQNIASGVIKADAVCHYVSAFLEAPKTFKDLGEAEWNAGVDWANSVSHVAERTGQASEEALKLARTAIEKAAKGINGSWNEIPPSKEVRGQSVIDMINKPTLTDTVRNLTGFDKQSQAKLLQAFPDIYKEICPGEPFPTKRNVSPMIAASTETYRFGRGVSTIAFLSSIYAQELFVNAKASLYDRLKNLREGEGLIGTVAKVDDRVKNGLTGVLTYVTNVVDKVFEKGAIGKDSITKMEMSVLKYNTAHAGREMSQMRGLHFAANISELAMFRSGNGDNVKTWFKCMRMTQEDAAWAIAYLKAGMSASIDGVHFNAEKAMAGAKNIINQYRMEADRTNYDQLIVDFETEHRQMVAHCNEMRKEIGEPELQKQMFFDRRRDDMPMGERLRWIDLTEQEFAKTDLKKVLEQYDAVIVQNENYLYYLGHNEKKIVVGQRDEDGCMRMCDLTYDTNHFMDFMKDHTLGACHQKAMEMELDYQVQLAASFKNNQEWEANLRLVVKDFMKNGFEAYTDASGNIGLTRGDLSVIIMQEDADPQRKMQEFVYKAKEQIWNTALQKVGITTEMAEEALRNTKVMESFNVQVHGTYADECREFTSLQGAVKLLTQDDFLDENKYNAVVTELQGNLERIAAGLTPQAEAKFSDRLDYILDTQEHDQELAAYLGLSENAYRCADGMIRGEYGGVEFVVENGKALAADEQGQPDLAMTIQMASGGLGDDYKEALSELWSLSTDINSESREAVKETEIEM